MCNRLKNICTKRLKTVEGLLVVLVLIASCCPASAQENDPYLGSLTTENFDPLIDNITDKLPPLEILIDSAIINSPYVGYEAAEVKLRSYMVRQARRYWTKYFGLDGGFSYGNFYQFYTNQASGSYATDFSSDRYETTYKIGVFLRMPLFDVLDRRNNINIARRQSEQSILRKEQVVRETKQDLIMTYQDLVLRQKLLKMANEAQVTTKLQVEMAEKEFLNGNIPISELSRLTEIHSRNISEFIKQSSLFYQQYLILEEMVGMKFNLLSEIN